MSLYFQAVVTGYFQFSNSTKPIGFYPFYVASLRYLEYDPSKSIEFAVVSFITKLRTKFFKNNSVFLFY